MKKVRLVPPVMPYGCCGTVTSVDADLLRCIAIGGVSICEQCGSELDVLGFLAQSIEDRNIGFHPVGFGGGGTHVVTARMARGELLTINLAEVNIPPDADVVSAGGSVSQHSLRAGVVALPQWIKASPETARWTKGRLSFGLIELRDKVGSQSSWEECDVDLFITWAFLDDRNQHWSLAQSGLDAFTSGDLVRAVLDALSAVDWLSGEVLEKALGAGGFKPDRRSMGSVPVRCAMISKLRKAQGGRPLSDEVLAGVQVLNSLRNRGGVAHPGDAKTDFRKVAECLAVTISVLAYLEQ